MHSQIDFRLPTMMRELDIHGHGQQNFPPGEPPIGRIVASLSVVLGNAGISESFKPAQN